MKYETYEDHDVIDTCPDCGQRTLLRTVNTPWGECSNCGHSGEIEFYEANRIGSGLSDPDVFDEIPEGCAACGGPYPDCMDSCNLFDL